MKYSLIAIAACGLMNGACSVRSPEGGGAYSMLQNEPQTSASLAPASVPDSVPAASARMPGDLTKPIAERSRGAVDPVASLGSSARARGQWETLHPKDMTTRVPTLSALSPVTPGPRSAKAPETAETPPASVNTYDRAAKMQGLIDGGRAAARGICSGC